MAKKRKKMTLGDKITAVVFYSLIISFVVYALVSGSEGALSLLILLIIGLIVSLPFAPLIRWMERGEKQEDPLKKAGFYDIFPHERDD